MCFSMVNCNKVSLPSIQGRLKSFNKLKCKFKLFIALLICTIVVIYLYGSRMEAKSEFKTAPPKVNWVNKVSPTSRGRESPGFENGTRKLAGGLEAFSQREIIILMATAIWGSLHPPTIVLDSDKCSILKTGTTQQPPVSLLFDRPCRITHNHSYLIGSHAVVFHSPDIHHWYSKLPTTLLRTQDQIWVWYQTESPLQTKLNLRAYKNIFNWTMSYRRDSDVYYPYGYIYPHKVSNNLTAFPRPSTLSTPLDRKSLKMKTGLAAWIVSSCTTPSKRKEFVDELQKYIPVDIYGTCGIKPCPQIQDKGYFACYKHIQSKYKFYLAFENSLCVDYITEKFFLALQTDMVPVVYGGGIDDQMDYMSVAPENSFIDARRFKSPQDLANYLIYLGKNDDEYLKYFGWKTKYKAAYKEYGHYGVGWCNLCQRLYDKLQTRRVEPLWKKWYSDLYTWWNSTSGFNGSAMFPLLTSVSKSTVNPVGQTFQFSAEKPKPTCVLPKDNFLHYKVD